ncbi:MAG: hypothetical protein IH820_05670 [Bacteroidetes bacterium]|nr:hypothetical protein [Bacteroidota bacterium]
MTTPRLTVAKRLTELSGGSISVESEKGRGSVFTVCFPGTALPAKQTRARVFNMDRKPNNNA